MDRAERTMKVMIWGQKPRPSWLTISAPRAPSANQMDVSPTVTASPIPNRTRMISQMMGFIDGSFLDRGIDPRLVRWIRAAQPSAGCSGACHGRVSRLSGCGIIIPQAAGIFYTDMGLFSVKFINLHLLWPPGLVPTHPRSSARVFLRPHGSGMDGRCCEIRPVPIYWF